MYFNYHAKAKRLITEGHLVDCLITKKWNAISPALVLFFDCAPPMPIRQYRWQEYLPLLASKGFSVEPTAKQFPAQDDSKDA